MIRIVDTLPWEDRTRALSAAFLTGCIATTGFGMYLAGNDYWTHAILFFGVSIILLLSSVAMNGILSNSLQDSQQRDQMKAFEDLNKRFDQVWDEFANIRDELDAVKADRGGEISPTNGSKASNDLVL